MMCDTGGISRIWVTNPVATSVYSWSTINGYIVGSTTGTSIIVDTPGTYIVTQYLQAGCAPYAADTIIIGRIAPCEILLNNLVNFSAVLNNNLVRLEWTVMNNEFARYFDIERSSDGVHFWSLNRANVRPVVGVANYIYDDDISGQARFVYYRIRMKDISGSDRFTNMIRILLPPPSKNNVTIAPNPINGILQLQIVSVENSKVDIYIYDDLGKMIATEHTFVQQGNNRITVNDLVDKPTGMYQAIIFINTELFRQKIMLVR